MDQLAWLVETGWHTGFLDAVELARFRTAIGVARGRCAPESHPAAG